MKISKKAKSIIIGACLFSILFVICGSVLAATDLELNYPQVPGIGTANKETVKDLGFYAKYIVQMVFFITAGVCLAVIVLGGFFYIAANQKPAIVQQGQDMAKRGFLGLFIVVTSYLVLNTINPQLLTLKLKIDRLSPYDNSQNFAVPVATISFRGIDTAGVPKEIVAKAQKKTFVNKTTGEILAPEANIPLENKQEVLFVETPFLRAEQLVGQAQAEAMILAKLLEYCKCGQSFAFAQKESALNIKCVAGMDPEEAKRQLSDYNNLSPNAKLYTKEQALCLTQSDNCGTKGGIINSDAEPDPALNIKGARTCDLREVINVNSGKTKKDANNKDILDSYGNPVLEDQKYAIKEASGAQTLISNLSIEEQKGLIKLHREKLQYYASMLSPEKMKLSIEQMGILENKLKNSATRFLASNVQEEFFQSDMEQYMTKESAKGVAFDIQVPEQFAVDRNVLNQNQPSGPVAFNIFLPQNKNFFSLVKNSVKGLAFGFLKPQVAKAQIEGAAFGPATMFYPVGAENYQSFSVALGDVLKRNSEVDQEARRANLFSVLAEMSLEEVDRIFKECLTSAFGQADYNVGSNMQEIIRQAIQQGTADYVILTLSNASGEFASMVGDEIIKEINATADTHLKDKCVAKCATERSTDADCVDKCVKANIPPHFLSNQLAIIATEPLYKRLPEEIQKIFNSQLRQVVLSEKFNGYLDTEMLGLYSKVLGVSLEKSFSELIPFIKKSLNTKTEDFLNKQMPSVVGALHKFLGLEIENLRPILNQRAQDVGKNINAKVEEGVANNLEKFKATMPSIFTENKPWDECTKDWGSGYVFIQDTSNAPLYCTAYGPSDPRGVKGQCRKMTPEEVNLGVGEQKCQDGMVGFGTYRETGAMEQVCRKAHYCWSDAWEIDNVFEGVNRGQFKCGDCQWLQIGRVAELGNADTYAQIGKAGLRGLVDFTAEFAVALTETFLHTSVAFVEVLLEDEIFTPAEPYLKQAINLQDTLSSFLNSTLSNLLPPQLTGILNGNIENVLANICELGKPGSDLKIDLYSQFTWGGTATINVPQKGDDYYKISEASIDKVCHASKHLNTTLLNEIAVDAPGGQTIADVLQTKTADLILCGEISNGKPQEKCPIRDALNKTPAQLIFEKWGVPNIQDIIKGTPKKLLCGELAMIKDGATFKRPDEICNSIKVAKSKLIGQIPYVSEEEMAKKNFTEDEKKIYRLYCPFVWGACSNVAFSSSDIIAGKVGDIAADFIESGCDRAVIEAKNAKCLGDCLENPNKGFADLIDPIMQSDNNCPSVVKDKCRVCNFSKKSIIEQMIIGAFNATPIIGTVSQRDSIRKERELATYEWLNINYPVMVESFHKVALSRLITQAEWEQILKKQRDTEEINNIKNLLDQENVLSILISACNTGTKWSELLVKIPFGIVKPFVQGEATLLLEADKGEDKNFLNHSAEQLVLNYVCKNVKEEFKAKYPNNTFEYLWNKEGGDVRKSLPYSMESLDRPVIANVLGEILTNSAIEQEDKAPYVACLSLEYAPYEILGLDQNLIYYLRPKEYQILFNLIKDQLSPEERPEKLNAVLDALYGKKPVDVVSAYMNTLPESDPSKENITLLFNILTTKLKNQPANLEYSYGNNQKGNPWKDTLITILDRKVLKEKKVCDKAMDLSFLTKTPLELLRELLITEVPQSGSQFNLMEILAKYVPAINEPYMDLLGKQLGLDVKAYELFETKENFNKVVDKWAKKGQESIQDATDKAFMEAPAYLSRIVGDRLSSIFSGKLGTDIGNKTGGTCRVITKDEDCKTGEGEIIREKDGKKECCSMGAPAVCSPQCRQVAENEACNTLIGEARKEIGGKGYCCFDEKCNLCRPIPADIQTNFCKRQGETKDSRGLCCKERSLQETAGPAGGEKLCCTSVIECVTRKFLDHLDLLKDYIVNGPPPF